MHLTVADVSRIFTSMFEGTAQWWVSAAPPSQNTQIVLYFIYSSDQSIFFFTLIETFKYLIYKIVKKKDYCNFPEPSVKSCFVQPTVQTTVAERAPRTAT